MEQRLLPLEIPLGVQLPIPLPLQLKAATEKKQYAENLLKEMMGDNEIGTVWNRIVTWKCVTQERLDSKTLKAEHPTLYKKYANKSTYRRFSIKATE